MFYKEWLFGDEKEGLPVCHLLHAGAMHYFYLFIYYCAVVATHKYIQ